MAWPWQWMLDWVSKSIESVLRNTSLPLLDTKPFQDERRWSIVQAIMDRTSSAAHRPVDANELRTTAEELLSAMEAQGAILFNVRPRARLVFARGEITDLIEKLNSGNVVGDDGMIHRPYPAPDVTHPQSTHVSSLYSDEALRTLVEQVYANALIIYSDLVASWFPAFAPTLGLASILPMTFQGQLVPRAGSWGDPDFVYRMTPLPLDEVSTAVVQLVERREDLNIDREKMIEESRKLRELIMALHPGALGWANPRSAYTTLDVYRTTPATIQAYRWLWEDLHTLHMTKSPPPVGENW
jgi:hypothetical protein